MVDHVDKPSRKKTRAVFGVDGLEWFSVYSFQILHIIICILGEQAHSDLMDATLLYATNRMIRFGPH